MTAEIVKGKPAYFSQKAASMRPPACAVHADRRSNDRGNASWDVQYSTDASGFNEAACLCGARRQAI